MCVELYRSLGSPIEVIKDQLYLTSQKQIMGGLSPFYFSIDQDKWFDYLPFYSDFGPLELRQINRFYVNIKNLIKSNKTPIYFLTGTNKASMINSIFLASCFKMIYENLPPLDAFSPFQNIAKLIQPYRDASTIPSQYDLTILSCLKGLKKGIELGWFSPGSFNEDKCYFYEQVENGDMNWLIPGKLLAFASPYDPKQSEILGWKVTSPQELCPIFKEMKINHIVRLCNRLYDEQHFKRHGFKHSDLFFIDGTVPPPQIREQFLDIMETQDIIALHCKAGLGRTYVSFYFFFAYEFEFS